MNVRTILTPPKPPFPPADLDVESFRPTRLRLAPSGKQNLLARPGSCSKSCRDDYAPRDSRQRPDRGSAPLNRVDQKPRPIWRSPGSEAVSQNSDGHRRTLATGEPFPDSRC